MNLTKIGQGDWAEVYLNKADNKVYKFIYADDSTEQKYNKIKQGAKLQNQLAWFKLAPKVHSIGWCKGRIVIISDYLEGYKPSHDTAIDTSKLSLIANKLEQANIAHNDINSGNIMVSPDGDIKLIDFDNATYTDGGSSRDRNLLTRIGNLYSRN